MCEGTIWQQGNNKASTTHTNQTQHRTTQKTQPQQITDLQHTSETQQHTTNQINNNKQETIQNIQHQWQQWTTNTQQDSNTTHAPMMEEPYRTVWGGNLATKQQQCMNIAYKPHTTYNNTDNKTTTHHWHTTNKRNTTKHSKQNQQQQRRHHTEHTTPTTTMNEHYTQALATYNSNTHNN